MTKKVQPANRLKRYLTFCYGLSLISLILYLPPIVTILDENTEPRYIGIVGMVCFAKNVLEFLNIQNIDPHCQGDRWGHVESISGSTRV